MEQIAILYKIKLRNKCKFYQSFFSINSIKYCYLFFIIKEILTLVITSVMLYIFYKTDAFGLNELHMRIIMMVLVFAELMGYSKSSYGYISTFLDSYRLSSQSFFGFFRQTVIAHSIAELCFELPAILPIIVFSYLWLPQSMPGIILGLLIGLLVRINGIVHSLTKDIESRSDSIISALKASFGLLVAGIVLTIGFSVAKTALYQMKILVISSTYDESAMLNQLLMALRGPINWFKTFFSNYSLLFIVYFIILISLPIINNFRKYEYLWKGENSLYSHSAMEVIPLTEVSQRSLPFFKILYKLRLNMTFMQLMKIPEIMIWPILECIILFNIEGNLISKFILISWFYFIGNSNYVFALFITGDKAFNNYNDSVDLYYWRLVDESVLGVYEEKLSLLLLYTNKITWCQSIFACVLSLIFLKDKFLIFLSCLIIILLRRPMHIFNCRLASFPNFFAFANTCKNALRTSDSDESESIAVRLYVILRLPFILIPMIVIVLDYIYSFLSIYSSLAIILSLFILAYWVNLQIEQYIKKAGDILEKVNVPD